MKPSADTGMADRPCDVLESLDLNTEMPPGSFEFAQTASFGMESHCDRKYDANFRSMRRRVSTGHRVPSGLARAERSCARRFSTQEAPRV